MVWLVLISFGAFANNQETFREANEQYQNGNYQQAIESYESIIKKNNGQDATLYYNLGNAYLKLDQIGKAVLNFERAVNISPGNEDYDENLKIAQRLCIDDFSTIPDFFLLRWINMLSKIGSSTFWAVLSIFWLLVTILLFVLWLLDRLKINRKIVFIGTALGLVLSLSALYLGSIRKASEHHNTYGVILSAQVTLQIAPDIDSKRIFDIHEGLKVKIIDELGEWKKVELSNKEVGWIKSEDLERI